MQKMKTDSLAAPWPPGAARPTGFWMRLLVPRLALVATGLAASSSLWAPAVSAAPSPQTATPAAPGSPREFYNAGTQQLGQGKLREAETLLETALASQNEALQPPALYNLGHVRFAQGALELKKSPPARPTAAQGDAAAQQGAEAIRAADEALEGNDLQKMVAAYLRGRGVRKEMRAATEAVRRALTAYGTVMAKWQRAEGDFKSAHELKDTDTDAEHNADVVDQCIARLVDSLRELQQCQGGLGNKLTQLGEKLKQLKGRIPAPQMPPGAAGDDDEDDDDQPLGPPPGSQEGPSKEGKEMSLSEEQAGWLLEGYRLDKERRLPMGQGQPGQPKDRNRPTW